MRRLNWLMVLVLGVLLTAACSPAQNQVFARNVTAADCANPDAFLSQIPTGLITEAQAREALLQVCAGLFGTVAAPPPAAGMAPVFPAPSAVATPVPAKVGGIIVVPVGQ